MSLYIELESFGTRDAGRERLAAVLRAARSHDMHDHPVLDWACGANISGPTLAYDLRIVEDRMRWLAETAAENSVTPLLAVKSCSYSPYLDLAQRYLGGFDVSNANEYEVLPQYQQGRLVSVTAPVIPDDLGVFTSRGNRLIVSLDSLTQLDQYFARPQPCEYILRVQGTDLLRAAQPPDPAYYPVTRFGFSLHEVRELLRDSRVLANPPAGFHVHHGSERNQLSTFSMLLKGLAGIAGLLPRPPRYLNIGGGWHRLARQEVIQVMQESRQLFPQACEIMMEPGRWYAESAGYAIGTVRNVTIGGDVVRCTLDLSARCHLHWSNPTLLHRTDASHEQGCVVQFYGASCYESDLIGKYMLPCSGDVLADTGLVSGTQVVFGNVSTYSGEWNTTFNGIPRADLRWINP